VLGPVIIAIAAGLLQAYTNPLPPPVSADSSHSAVLE